MRQVHHVYPGWPPVVRGVDWSIAPGEFHALVGRSGCGKSTMLQLAAGLLTPTAGEVWVGGALVRQPGLGTGLVFQAPTLLDWLTARDNVLLPVSLRRRPTARDRDEAEQLLVQLGLAEHLDRHPRQLSGGQQSRVAIARALLLRPPLLLMDEPFAALDALTREELQDHLLALCRARGTAVLFVTHDMAEAVYLADRVAVMAEGRIRLDLPVDLPRPRQQALRYSPAFNALCARLRAAMDGEGAA